MNNPKYIRLYLIIVAIVMIITCVCFHSSRVNDYENQLHKLNDKSMLLMRKNDSLD